MSYHWVQQNIVMVGHDASGYLGTTLEYTEFLDEFSPQALFKAFTHHRYRPPALFMAVQPFYQAFGVDMDSAQLFNILLLAVVLLLTFWLGRQVANNRIALFATLLVGLLPMTMAMARLFYTEIFLTAAVIPSLYRALLVHPLGHQHGHWITGQMDYAHLCGFASVMGTLAESTLESFSPVAEFIELSSGHYRTHSGCPSRRALVLAQP